MSIGRLLFSGVVLVSAHVPAYAEQTREQRLIVVPYIRALTDCVAQRVLSDDEGATAYRGNYFSNFAVRKIGQCPDQVAALTDNYDRVSGEGAGLAFLNGPYSADLPRAVLHRIQPQLQAQLDKRDEEAAQQRARDDLAQRAAEQQRRRDDIAQAEEERRQEAERQTRAAEAEQKAAEAKAAAAQAEAQAAMAAAAAEAARQQQIADAKKAETLLIDKAAECSRKQLPGLVRSGETAEVLAGAVMVICSSDFDHAFDAGIAEFKVEQAMPPSAEGEGIYREKLRGQAHEAVMTMAVQAKAGVGSFAPASSN